MIRTITAEEITKNINLKNIKIVHLFASDATKNIKKRVETQPA